MPDHGVGVAPSLLESFLELARPKAIPENFKSISDSSGMHTFAAAGSLLLRRML